MNTLTARDPHAILTETFGFAEFRPHQRELVDAILAGSDAFGVMPTGGGKSLCYQLPAVALQGCAVVVSPLIALMKDQVDAARANGIRAACIHSSATTDERRETGRAYRDGELDLLYLAPERIALDGFLDGLRSCPSGAPAFFAIDEAHCLSEWGHDFRPDYLVLQRLRDEFPDTPLAAFTATATERVADDIATRLQLRNPIRIRASFDRANLFYEARLKDDPENQIVRFIQERPGQAGIVYRISRKSVEATAEILRANGIDARAYHAGMEGSERTAVQDAFIRDDTPVIVATIAFGMGIDKADVRFVVHGDLPRNIESYYQETGRAGRDGEPSHCLLLHSPADATKLRRFIREEDDEAERRRLYSLLGAMERYASIPACRRAGLLGYFGESFEPRDGADGRGGCGGCDFCAGHFEESDATRDAQVFLSAILRTGERFGPAHLCDLITGTETPKIRQFRHESLKTFGAGNGQPKSHWRRILDALVASGAARVEESGYGNPQLTDTGWQILNGERPFVLHRDKRDPETPANSPGHQRKAPAGFPFHQGLFERLKILRKEIADADDVPPYTVLSDRTLREMAATMPTDAQGLDLLHGIGTHKRENYGKRFLAAVADFLATTPDAAAARIPVTEIRGFSSPVRRPLGGTASATLAMVRAGADPATIAERRGLALGTIENHIAELIGSRTPGLDVEQFVPADLVALARELFAKHGTDTLRPVVEESGNRISFGQAKIVRAALPDRT
ncbi:DNA helicase RecQ [soil metagenome]